MLHFVHILAYFFSSSTGGVVFHGGVACCYSSARVMIYVILFPSTKTASPETQQPLGVLTFALVPHQTTCALYCAVQVLVVAVGEAVRIGDRRADSFKNATSLRVKPGQLFGVEEVRLWKESQPGRKGHICFSGEALMLTSSLEVLTCSAIDATEGLTTIVYGI